MHFIPHYHYVQEMKHALANTVGVQRMAANVG